MIGRLRGMFSRDPGSVVALDVGPNAVRAIRGRKLDGDPVIDGFRIVGVDPTRTLADACRDVLSLRIDREPVAVSVRSNEAAIRQIELPPMSAAELREALPWEARRHVAGLGDDAVLDAQILGGGDDGPMNVLLVAFPRRTFDDLAALWEQIGIDPAFVDLAPLSVMNAVLAPGDDTPQAILDLGATTASFSIFSASGVVLFRDLAVRTSRIDSLLSVAFGLGDDKLDAFKRSGKSAGPAPARAELEKALAEVLGDLGEDLRAGRLYLENRTGSTLDHVWIAGSTGGFLERSGLTETISGVSGTSIERLNPFQRFRLVGVDEIGLKSHALELAAAAGVAVRALRS